MSGISPSRIVSGFVPPAFVAPPSLAAPQSLAAAIAASPGVHMLPQPRTLANQRDLPCCVSCALAAAMEIRHEDWPALSPLFHYHVTRFVNNGAASSGELFLADALSTLTRQGICRAADHSVSFDTAGLRIAPSAAAFTDAATRRIVRNGLLFAYQEIGGVSRAAAIREFLRRGRPVVMGFRLPQGYPQLPAGHLWLDRTSPAPSNSHHCVLIRGFDDLRRAFRVHDSRGPQAFDGGGWWISYAVVESHVYSAAYALT